MWWNSVDLTWFNSFNPHQTDQIRQKQSVEIITWICLIFKIKPLVPACSFPQLERYFDESEGKCTAGQNVKPLHVYLASNISPSCWQFLLGSILRLGRSGDDKDVKKSGSLTQLWSFAKSEGVGPQFGDGGVVEHVITHWVPEAGCSDHVHHVKSSPHRSDNTAE